MASFAALRMTHGALLTVAAFPRFPGRAGGAVAPVSCSPFPFGSSLPFGSSTASATPPFEAASAASAATRARYSAVTSTSPSRSTSSLSCTSGMIRVPWSSLRRNTRSRKMSTAITFSAPTAVRIVFPSLGKRLRAAT